MNALPNAATTSSGPSPPAIPVASPATVTTSSGLIRSTNPTTTMTIPISENMKLVRPPDPDAEYWRHKIRNLARVLQGHLGLSPLRIPGVTLVPGILEPCVQRVVN